MAFKRASIPDDAMDALLFLHLCDTVGKEEIQRTFVRNYLLDTPVVTLEAMETMLGFNDMLLDGSAEYVDEHGEVTLPSV